MSRVDLGATRPITNHHVTGIESWNLQKFHLNSLDAAEERIPSPRTTGVSQDVLVQALVPLQIVADEPWQVRANVAR
jgi:hypothetical protein